MKYKAYSFEADIIGHCNFRCAGCSHLSPLRSNETRDPDELAQDLANLGAIAEASKFILIGGEPTLHPQLERITRIVKASGIAPLIEMWTNGSMFERVTDAALTNIDSIVMNRYPGKITDEQVAEIWRRCEAHQVTLEIDNPSQFYLNLTDKPRTDTQKLFKTCPYQTHCWTIKGGYLFRCPQSSVIPRYVMGIENENIDGILLEGLTYDGLVEYLTSTKPRAACSRCARQEVWQPWRETTKAEFIAQSARMI